MVVVRSFAFYIWFGVGKRRHKQEAVYRGMLGVTFFGIFLTPIFYYVLQSFSEWCYGGVHQGHVRRTGTPDGLPLVTTAHQSSAMSDGH